jgi:prepilin-type N-terminal cleavage/methylation domain-containing protein
MVPTVYCRPDPLHDTVIHSIFRGGPTLLCIWRRRYFRLGNQRGFTLIESIIVIAVISILAATAITLFSNIQARARAGKAQADLRSLYWAIVAFGAHCGDTPNTATTFTAVAPLTLSAGTTTCGAAVGGDLAVLGQQVTDAINVPQGPFYQGGTDLTPPAGWTYTYTHTGTGRFTLTAANPSYSPNPITLP